MCICKKLVSESRVFIMCASKKGKAFSNSILNGEVFFIISEKPVYDKLKDIIVHLKGKVETFFSKEITTLLVEDNHIEEFHLPYHALNHHFNVRTTNEVPTPVRITEQIIDKNTPTTSSRGYTLLARSAASVQPNPRNVMVDSYVLKVISMANMWGIRVVGIHKFMSWSHTIIKLPISTQNVKSRVTKPKGIKIPGHFVKIEDVAQKFRPLYRVISEESARSFELLNPNCASANFVPDNRPKEHPFHPPHPAKDVAACAVINPAPDTGLKDLGGAKAKCNTKNAAKAKPKTKKKPQQYCECCNVNFSNLTQHIKGAKHQAFATNDSNYQCIIDIIKHFPTHQEFIENHQRKYFKKIQNETLNLSCNHSATSLQGEVVVDSSRNMLANNSVPFVNNFNQGTAMNLKNSNPCFLDLHKLALNIAEGAKEESQKDLETSVSIVPQEIHISDIFSQKSGFVTGVDLSGQDYEDCWVDVFQECDMNQDSLFAGDGFSISNAEHSISQVFRTEGNSLSFKEFASNEIAQPANIGASASTSLLNTEATCSTKSSFVVPAGDGSSKHQVDNPVNCNQRSLSQKDLNFDFNSELNFLNSAFEDSKLESFSFNNLNISNTQMPDVYFEKSDQVNPCSSFLVRADHMFSSSSSDDGTDGKSIINNVLSIINKSASEVEVGHERSRSSHESKLKSPSFKKNVADAKSHVDDKSVFNNVLSAIDENAVVTKAAEVEPMISVDKLKPAAVTCDVVAVKICDKQPRIVGSCEIKSENARVDKEVKICDKLQKVFLRDESEAPKSKEMLKETLVPGNQNIMLFSEFRAPSNSKMHSEVIKNEVLSIVGSDKRKAELQIVSKKSEGEIKAAGMRNLFDGTDLCDVINSLSGVDEVKPFGCLADYDKIQGDLSLANEELKSVNIEKMEVDVKPQFGHCNMKNDEYKTSADPKCDEVVIASVAEDNKFLSMKTCEEIKIEEKSSEVHESREKASVEGEVSAKLVECSHLSPPSLEKCNKNETKNTLVGVCEERDKISLDTRPQSEMYVKTLPASMDCNKSLHVLVEGMEIKACDNQKVRDVELRCCESNTHHEVDSLLPSGHVVAVKAEGSSTGACLTQDNALNLSKSTRKPVSNEMCVLAQSQPLSTGVGSQNETCREINMSEVKCTDDLNKSEEMEISFAEESALVDDSKAYNEMDIASGTSGIILPHYSDVSSEIPSSSSGEYFLRRFGLPKPSSLWTVESVSEDKMRLKFSRVHHDICGDSLNKPDDRLSRFAEYSDAMNTGS